MLNSDKKYLIAINTFENFGASNLLKIKKYFSSYKNCFFNKNINELLKAGISQQNSQKFLQWISKINPEEEIEKIIKNNIKITIPTDENFPQLLKEIHNPPQILYYQGNISKLNKNLNISIVGSRKYTLYGEKVAQKITKELCVNNINIISGLALGIDSIAHTSALQNNAYTAAVLGTSLEKEAIYPKENKNIANDIIEKKGCLISEFPLKTKPMPYNFPQRNRIIAGLSQGTLIIEATQKSGTLITARLALEQNRDVFAIPGNIYNTSSQGTNNLIKQGAIPVTDSKDILDFFKINSQKTSKPATINLQLLEKLSNTEKIILQNISAQESIQIDDLIRNTKISTSEVNCAITNLELSKIIKNIGNKQYTVII